MRPLRHDVRGLLHFEVARVDQSSSAMRNRIARNYWTVDKDIVWAVIEQHAPQLHQVPAGEIKLRGYCSPPTEIASLFARMGATQSSDIDNAGGEPPSVGGARVSAPSST